MTIEEWEELTEPLSSRDRTEQQTLQLAVPISVVERLMTEGHLCAADVRCLDAESKRRLHRLCLEACARCLASGRCRPAATRDRCRAQGQDCAISERTCTCASHLA